MAANLARAGYAVTIWTRSGTLPDSLAETAVEVVPTLAELGAEHPVVLTVLPDLPEVVEVVDGPEGLLSRAEPGTLIVVMGTVSPPRLVAWAADVAERGHRVVDAPLSGGVEGARAGSLSVMVGGEAADVAKLDAILDAVGSTVRHLGPIGSGQLAKACNQSIVATTLTALAEAVTLARHAGLDTEMLLDVLAGGYAGSRLLDEKGSRYLTGDFEAGGAAAFQHKDLGFVLESARSVGVAMPVAALVDQLFGAMTSTGRGGLDHSGVIEIVELLSGSDRTSVRPDPDSP